MDNVVAIAPPCADLMEHSRTNDDIIIQSAQDADAHWMETVFQDFVNETYNPK